MCEYHPVETRGRRTFEKTTFHMKNEYILNNEDVCDAAMDRIRQCASRPEKFFASMIAVLHGDEAKAIDCVCVCVCVCVCM